MNNKYKSAFSSVYPSESSVERIFDMTKSKKLTFKPFLIAAIIAVIMAITLVSANAVTDGAIAETAEKIVESVKIFIGGEEAKPEDVGYEHSSEIINGKQYDSHSFAIGKDGQDGFVSFNIGENGVIIDGEGFEGVMVEDNGLDGFKAKVEAGENSFDVAVAGDNASSDSLDMENFNADYAELQSVPDNKNR